MGWGRWAPPMSPSQLGQLSRYAPPVLVCKATINLNFICFAKVHLNGRFSRSTGEAEPTALGAGAFPPLPAELRRLFPADLGDPAAFPAGSLRTKPDSLGKPGAAGDAGSYVRDGEGADGSPQGSRAPRASPAPLDAKQNPLSRPLPSRAASSTLAQHLQARCCPARGGRARETSAAGMGGRPGLRHGCSPPAGPALLNAASVLPLGSKNVAFVSSAQPPLVTGALARSSRPPSAGRNVAQLWPAAATT